MVVTKGVKLAFFSSTFGASFIKSIQVVPVELDGADGVEDLGVVVGPPKVNGTNTGLAPVGSDEVLGVVEAVLKGIKVVGASGIGGFVSKGAGSGVGGFVSIGGGSFIGGVTSIGFIGGGVKSIGLRVGGVISIGLGVGGVISTGFGIGGVISIGFGIGGVISTGFGMGGGVISTGFGIGGIISTGCGGSEDKSGGSVVGSSVPSNIFNASSRLGELSRLGVVV